MVRQSAVLIVAGLVVGLVLIRLAESALARVLFGVTPSDAVSTVAASAVLLDRGADRVHSARAPRDASGSGGRIARGIGPGGSNEQDECFRHTPDGLTCPVEGLEALRVGRWIPRPSR